MIRRATTADGREIEVRVVVPDDPYLDRSELSTVVVELEADGEPIAVVATPLQPDEVAEALLLGDRLRTGLESGALEPSAGGIEVIASARPE